MATNTKKPKRKSKASAGPPAERVEIPDTRHEIERYTEDLPVDRIDRSPYQPRQAFPEEEIERLAASIAQTGLVHPIAVRRSPGSRGRYELVDGERRLRACRKLGLKQVRVEVGEYSDAEVMAIVVATAIQRQALNPIEEALAFQRAIDSGAAAGPTELARQLGLSQGHISNRIRLLELPAEWQARIISGEIPPTHGRCLLKYSGYPAILARVADEIACDYSEISGCHSTVETFAESLESIAQDCSKPMEGTYYENRRGKVPVFAPTDEQAAQLGIIEIQTRWGKGPERRATNEKLWEKLQQEFLAARDKRAEEKADQAAVKTAAKKSEPTPAQKKAAAAELKRKAAERQKQFAKRLWEWYLDWLRYLIATRLRQSATVHELLVIAVYFRCVHITTSFSPLAGLEAACQAEAPDVKVKGKAGWYGTHVDAMDTLPQLGEMDIEPVLGRTMAEWFFESSGDGPVHIAYAEDLPKIAEFLKINPGTCWFTANQAGPLTEQYWNLHTKDQLLELCEELGVGIEPAAKKTDLVDALMAAGRAEKTLAMPEELVTVKRPKR